MVKQEYPHFNPTHYDIDVKIAVVESRGHSKYNINYHLLWSFGKRFPNLWARGYYVGSAGHVSQDAVKRYILEQEGKDVFEYNIFGNPNVKIGKFSLERWIK